MFIDFLVIGFIISTVTITIILFTRKLFYRQMSSMWRYNIWFLLLVALAIPFLPSQLLHAIQLSIPFENNLPSSWSRANLDHNETTSAMNSNWMQDFSVSVNQSSPDFLNISLMLIWICGTFIFTIFAIQALLKLRKIKISIDKIKNKDVTAIFESCKKQLHISKDITLGTSSSVQSPVTFGFTHTYVVLPSHIDNQMSKEDLQHIFLHELHHVKYKDIHTNYLMMFYQIIYWFNPLVWIALKKMRLDREIACDTSVLNMLDDYEQNIKYGRAMINFIDFTAKKRYNHLTNEFNGSKKQVKQRLEEIMAFQKESKLLKLKSMIIFIVVGLLITSLIPFVSVLAHDSNQYENFTAKKVMYEDLSSYFNESDGSFVLYDLREDEFLIYNKEKSTMRVSPASTYKIYSALIALEEGIITSEDNTIEWNGVEQNYEQWNQDQTLTSALTYSVNWYFQTLDKASGLNTIKDYLTYMNYGNEDISGGIDDHWLVSSLKISPVEQVELLQSFYNNAFDFQEEHIQSVKDALKVEETEAVTLYGKTGTGNINGKDINGWFIGFVETHNKTYFFATNVQDIANATGSRATEITLSILRDKQIYY
ncbi:MULTISPECIES: BlaR1 family beta-lactam sensor/signal transducer [Oceanobacillus]|uniref:BlaR1 family beta-lactam sensor/signal transducer n=1 Tax=Oceanobacillus TaxID=182709 RepID=UPI00084ECB23|nr:MULTISPECIES: BlaR1 family beta-lactam sensor/signal transducer [Oceanobacillus]MBT2600403.1 BlaR1 family beta-lactam sensor/signal transducer [Oceanobacillus sp. ISL-74]MBT2650561.1 BlaR1 family beta-lactam sensor/signal transducer [Oceanobacillus sp. ISL-73]OEH54896.1 BlaR1 family beta-lactam sensor/signal transducer [Oceanobacillus sp. E9]